MYICEKHGILESEWCGDCGEIVECDCSDIVITRFYDLVYDTKQGEHTTGINLCHCDTCGKIAGCNIT